MSDAAVRGVIDRFEGDYAILVLDDEQQLDWPRSTLPDDVRPGVAVVLSLTLGIRCAPHWRGELSTHEETGGWVIRMADGQSLRWPTALDPMAQAGGSVSLQLMVDAEDTAARRQRVADLLDDIFRTPD